MSKYDDPDDFTAEYDQFIDETNPTVRIEGLSYDPSVVLKAVDQGGYWQGLLNYVDSLAQDDTDDDDEENDE